MNQLELERRWLGMALACLVAICPLAAGETLVIEHAVVARQAEADNGTAHVYVRNVNEAPVSITSAALSFADADAAAQSLVRLATGAGHEETTASHIWWRALPNPIPAGGYADLAIKLARPPTRKLAVTFSGPGHDVQCVLDRINDPLQITSLGVSPDRQKLFVYAENRLDQAMQITRVFINGSDYMSRTRCLPKILGPHGKIALIVSLDKPVAPGSFLFIRVGSDTGAEGITLVRPFTGFPITWLDGSLPEGVDAPEGGAPIRAGSVPNEGLAGIENIMRCPAHAHGPRHEAAAKFIARHQQLIQAEPQIPGMIYVCRWEKELNYFVFGELGDLVRIMPFAGSFSYLPDPLNHRLQWLTALAVRAAAPRPVHAVVPMRFADSFQWERSITPEEVRALAYLPISRGARGLCYGRREEGLNPESQRELAKVSREIAGLREYLAYAEPFPLARVNQPLMEAATLLAGDRALILLVINHSFEDFDNQSVLELASKGPVRIEMSLPGDLKISSVRDVVGEIELSERWHQTADRCVLECESTSVVQPYLMLFEQSQSGVTVKTREEGGRAE